MAFDIFFSLCKFFSSRYRFHYIDDFIIFFFSLHEVYKQELCSTESVKYLMLRILSTWFLRHRILYRLRVTWASFSEGWGVRDLKEVARLKMLKCLNS